MTGAGARQPGAHSPVFFRAFASQNDAKFEPPPPPIYISCTLPTAALHSLRTPFVSSNQTSRRHLPNTTLETRSHSREREGFDVEAAKLILVGSVGERSVMLNTTTNKMVEPLPPSLLLHIRSMRNRRCTLLDGESLPVPSVLRPTPRPVRPF